DAFVAAIQSLQEEMKSQGHPPFWMSYVAVDSVDKSAAQVEELGGRILAPPFDVMDVGRMAVIQDPSKAALALWEAKAHPGAGIVGEPGALCWNELSTNDVDRAESFYTSLFGWTSEKQDMGGFVYTVFGNAQREVAGMAPINSEMGPMPPSWGVSFAVEDADDSAARVKDLGGEVVMGPTDFPGGRFAVARDPQGAFFSVVKLNEWPEA
ncbi:MAG: VOC family protein, partial [Actinomycetota bacterium]|nr:VOC family protein [Actinomycetota bacterium]